MAAFIEWTSQLETGISKIDFQHHNLVDMINEIADVANEQDPNLRDFIVQNTIGRLLEYTNYHFKTEEDLFTKSNYAHAEEHTKAHEALRVSVVDLYNRFAKGEDAVGQLLLFLKSWLENHIIGTDMKYVDTLKKFNPDVL